MNSRAKTLLTLILFTSMAVVSCGKNPIKTSEPDNSQIIQPSSNVESSVDNKEQSSIVHSSNNGSSGLYSSNENFGSSITESSSNGSFSSEDSSQPVCENELHSYVRYSPVEGGHRKKCDNCNEYLSEKESHVYFSNDILYCPGCGFYDEKMTKYSLPNEFNVVVRTADGTATRNILANLYQTSSGALFTLSSPRNAHASYMDSNVEGAKFYYDSEVDDGTKLFMLKETASRETIGTCKTIYNYTLYVYGGIALGSFSYLDGHISIGTNNVGDWLATQTPLSQVTYKYLSVQHHAEDYRVPVPGTSATIVEYTCEDCGQFLYQEVIYNN